MSSIFYVFSRDFTLCRSIQFPNRPTFTVFFNNIAELKASDERVAKMPWSTYLKETGKNLFAGIARTPPEMLKGVAVITKTLGDLGIADPYGYGIALPGSGGAFKVLIDAGILPKPNKSVLEPNGTVQDSPYYRLGDYLKKILTKICSLTRTLRKHFSAGLRRRRLAAH